MHPPCVGYTVTFTEDAKKDLRKLEKQTIVKIFEKTKELISTQLDKLNIKKLKSKDSLYRLKVGDYRVVYCIRRAEIIVYVIAVGHRKDIYDRLNRRMIR